MSKMINSTTKAAEKSETKVVTTQEIKEDQTSIAATTPQVETAPVVESPKKAPAKKAKKDTTQKTKKETTKKEATKKEATKKEVSKKTSTKKTSSKLSKEVIPNVFFQFLGNELDVNAINAQIKEDWANNGNDIHTIETLDIYIKPEEAAAYYVVNKESTGKIIL